MRFLSIERKIIIIRQPKFWRINSITTIRRNDRNEWPSTHCTRCFIKRSFITPSHPSPRPLLWTQSRKRNKVFLSTKTWTYLLIKFLITLKNSKVFPTDGTSPPFEDEVVRLLRDKLIDFFLHRRLTKLKHFVLFGIATLQHLRVYPYTSCLYASSLNIFLLSSFPYTQIIFSPVLSHLRRWRSLAGLWWNLSRWRISGCFDGTLRRCCL